MSFTAIWMEPAVAAYRRLRGEDQSGVVVVGAAIRRLAEDPRPPNSRRLGTSAFYRLRMFRDKERIVYVVNLTRVG